MQILNGKVVAQKILEEVGADIAGKKDKPGLAVILVGNDKASHIYVNLKERTAKNIGMDFFRIEFPADASEEEILSKINSLNQDARVDGIIVQLPLPEHLDKNKIIHSIDSRKDADGFHDENIKLFFEEKEAIYPVFPRAIWEIIKSAGQDVYGKTGMIICNSEEFGKTMQFLLGKKGVEARYIHKDDIEKELPEIKKADIVISACGEAEFIRGEMLKDGSIVIDGGITEVEGKVLGDVDLDSVKDKPGFISPVPGGVGPVTIACLLKNVWRSSGR